MARSATSADRLEEAEMQYRSAQAAVEQSKAAKEELLLTQGRQNVLSPISGKIMMFYKNPGSFVTAGTPVALVGDFSALTFTITIEKIEEETWFLRRFVGKPMVFSTNRSSMGKVYSPEYGESNKGYDQKFPAHIVSVLPDLSQEAVMRSVTVEIDNSMDMLEPLMYRNVMLEGAEPIACLSVPVEAMVTNEQDTVLVVDSENCVERRSVVTGASNKNYIEILSGLEEGDIVVISDKEGLDDGTRVNVTMDSDVRDGEK